MGGHLPLLHWDFKHLAQQCLPLDNIKWLLHIRQEMAMELASIIPPIMDRHGHSRPPPQVSVECIK